MNEQGVEPDARFTFANERTFLAWNRTAVALVVAGLAITQLLPPFPGIPGGRHLVGLPLIVLGLVLSLTSYRQWARNQRALRLDQPLPPSNLPRLVALLVAAVAATAAVLVLVSQGGPGL
jgi:putative membrane protein